MHIYLLCYYPRVSSTEKEVAHTENTLGQQTYDLTVRSALYVSCNSVPNFRTQQPEIIVMTLAPLYNSFRDYAARFLGRSSPKSAARSNTSFHTAGGRVRARRALRYFQCPLTFRLPESLYIGLTSDMNFVYS